MYDLDNVDNPERPLNLNKLNTSCYSSNFALDIIIMKIMR